MAWISGGKDKLPYLYEFDNGKLFSLACEQSEVRSLTTPASTCTMTKAERAMSSTETYRRSEERKGLSWHKLSLLRRGDGPRIQNENGFRRHRVSQCRRSQRHSRAAVLEIEYEALTSETVTAATLPA